MILINNYHLNRNLIFRLKNYRRNQTARESVKLIPLYGKYCRVGYQMTTQFPLYACLCSEFVQPSGTASNSESRNKEGKQKQKLFHLPWDASSGRKRMEDIVVN